jgi:hypothetical protein
MGSQKLDKIIDSTELLINSLLKHIHKCDHSCCVKDVLSGIYEDNKVTAWVQQDPNSECQTTNQPRLKEVADIDV